MEQENNILDDFGEVEEFKTVNKFTEEELDDIAVLFSIVDEYAEENKDKNETNNEENE